MINDGIKICSGCKRELPATSVYFSRNKYSPDGLYSKCKECKSTYRKDNKDRFNEYWGLYRKEHIEEIRRYGKKFRDNHATEEKLRHFEYGQKIKLQIITHYGGKCACCGESNLMFLTVDHINGGGTEQIKSFSGYGFYRWIINNNFPSGFQVLCHNCNWLKYLNSIKRVNGRYARIRSTVIGYYGGKCECCGEENFDVLSVDHICGGGCKHRKDVGSGIYDWIIYNNFPSDFRILCRNCNFAIGHYGICSHNTESLVAV